MGTPQKNYIIETTGSGVALLDYDNDGWVDIYLVNGSTLEALDGKAAARRGPRSFTTITMAHSPMSPGVPVLPMTAGVLALRSATMTTMAGRIFMSRTSGKTVSITITTTVRLPTWRKGLV